MNILITGVDGFIGTALWNYLKVHKPAVRTFGVDVQRKRSSPFLFSCDITNTSKLKKVFGKVRPDIIFHLAGGRPANENLFWQVNVVPTQTLLNAVSQTKNLRPIIVIPGSAAEYGKVKAPQRLIRETVKPRPAALYGFVKYMQTSLGLMYARRGLDVRIVRIFNIGGYGTPSALALGNFAERIVRIERRLESPLMKVGNLSGRRDFLDITDVCSALWAVARKGKSAEVYNVCSGRLLGLRLLLRQLLAHAKVKNIDVQEEQKASLETFDIGGSNAKIKRVTGWRPTVSMKQSLKNTLQYYRQRS